MTKRTVLQLAGFAVAAACIAASFRPGDVADGWRAIHALGPVVALALLPYGAAVALDGLGWSRAFASCGRRLSFVHLLSVRLSAEAMLLALPGGALLAESLKPVLLESRHGVPLGEGVSLVAARKCRIVMGHGLFLSLATVAGWSFLEGHSLRLTGGTLLPIVLAIGAATLLALATGMRWIACRGASRLGGILGRLRNERLRRTLADACGRADHHLRRALSSDPAAIALYVAMWAAEALETWLLLQLLGVDIGLGGALALEGIISVVRAGAFFVPAGLGVQDAGYAAFLHGAGGSTILAFALIKRARELAWLGIGWIIVIAYMKLAVLRSRGALPAA